MKISMDRLMADVERLTLACAWWQLSSAARPLHVDAPAQDERANAEWDAARDTEHDRANALLDRLHYPPEVVLAAMRGSYRRAVTARRHAAHALRRTFGRDVPTRAVHGFGPGWRDMGSVSL